MTDTRTQALAAQYSRIMGTEDQAYHLGAMPAVARTTIAECPDCGTKATVLEDRAAGLLERWRREHDEQDKRRAGCTHCENGAYFCACKEPDLARQMESELMAVRAEIEAEEPCD